VTDKVDAVNPFVPGTDIRIPGAASGPLAELTFVAKDLFDIAGFPTGGGSPDWPRDQLLPGKHAWAVQTLLDGGANLIGKTITDEISLGILGENAFEGTPSNVNAPGRVPGGSSSGSAAAVTAGIADIAIGTDTGGSVRVPSSFCGLYGIRPTHGRLPLDGMAPQAPTSDTTGWFARDGDKFARTSAVMLGEPVADDARPSTLVVATDAFGFADDGVAAALAPLVDRLKALSGTVREDLLAPQGLSTWARAQRAIQPYEAWKTFEAWVDQYNPRMTFTVARGLIAGASIPVAERTWAGYMRMEARARLRMLTADGGVLCMPTTPFPAPKQGLAVSAMDPFKDRITCLASLGGLAGHPQISIPGGQVDGLPIGLSIIGARGADAQLASIARTTGKEFE
jgi:amidase